MFLSAYPSVDGGGKVSAEGVKIKRWLRIMSEATSLRQSLPADQADLPLCEAALSLLEQNPLDSSHVL